MTNLILHKLLDPQFLFTLMVAVATGATIITLGMTFVEGDGLSRRMRAVSIEREAIRARERERLNKNTGPKVSLRQQPTAYMKKVVDQLNLSSWLGTETAKLRLAMAGYRGKQAETAFLFFRLVSPISLFLITVFYAFVIFSDKYSIMVRLIAVVAALYLGVKAPEIFLKNQTSKRQLSMRRALPDAMDLLLICVESGVSIEHAFRKVAAEVGTQSVPLAEELTLTTAELSYLQERRQAFENLATRTGVDAIKAITTALVQAERYGTPVGVALRVLAQESRDHRMNEAEKKAAALPPKLTVPMILFFLPVLFAVILTPALIQIFNWD
ncbi:MAG: type II secretion system F family protein [Hyphomicrobiales bacterium]|nr:type II secretion system F family protein [Hyphomicrobiales bacterium]MBV9519251.1 type II secretion system F family protein [Hyphomicrobiales bacterium]